MNWKLLLPVPVAAYLLGTPVETPHLQKPIPTCREMGCDTCMATSLYLSAYAYAAELPLVSRKYLRASERELQLCRGNTSALSLRLEALKKKLFP